MLKIKDNIDLKELEKFGFKKGEYTYSKPYKQETNKRGYISRDWFFYIPTGREGSGWSEDFGARAIVLSDLIYGKTRLATKDEVQELIQADIVEEV